MYKKKFPLTVLSGELVLNFRKVHNPRTIAITRIGGDVTRLIKDSAEQTVVKHQGATTEEIYNDLIPRLLEHGLLGEVKSKLDDITPLLRQDFDFSDWDKQWHIRPNTRLGSFIPLEERIRFYLLDFLKRMEREGKQATFDQIIFDVMPKLINGETPERQTILNVLQTMAYSPDGQHWILAPASAQLSLPLVEAESALLPRLPMPTEPRDIEHNALIYRLAMMGKAARLTVWIGKKEQTEQFNGESFENLSLKQLPIGQMTDEQRRKVSQIDVIWFGADGAPSYAFEVEASTPIMTALERFARLLELAPEIAQKLVIIAPRSRKQKLDQVLQKSTYIGHPLYMENKVMYAFDDDLARVYHELENAQTKEIISRLRNVLQPAMR
jgi:hypothetical protein